MNQVIFPAIQNLTLTLADTEYYLDLPAGCQHFSFQCSTAADIRFAWVTGKVAGPTAPWATLKSGSSFSSPEKLSLKQGYQRVYFAGDAGGEIVELVAWAP